MATLQKSVIYSGTNADLLRTDFPDLTEVRVDFLIPTYTFSRTVNASPERIFQQNTRLTDTMAISDKAYLLPIETDLITGKDVTAFLSYYESNYSNPAGFDYQKFTDSLLVPIQTEIDTIPAQSLSALPLILMTGNTALLSPRIRSLMAMDPEVMSSGFRQYLDQNLCLLNKDVVDKMVGELRDVSPAKLIVFLSYTLTSDGKAVSLK